MKKLIALALALVLCLSAAAALADGVYEGQRVRIVIGSTSVSGDSYMVAETVNQYLKKYLNCDSKVDAVGANEALGTIATAKPDGLTMMIFHDMTYLGVLFEAYDDMYALENMVIGPRVGQNPGSCFGASKDAPYNDLKEAAEWLVANPDETLRVSVEAGGVSQIGFVAYYAWVKDTYGEDVAKRVKVVLGGSTDTKLQQLWDGNTDVIFADYSSLLQYTQEGVDAQLAIKFVGMLDNIPGVEGLPVMGDFGVTMGGEPFYFSKDFLIYLPAGTPDEVLAELDAAIEKVAADPDFQADMTKLTYAGNTLTSAEAKDFIYNKRDTIAQVLGDVPSFDELLGE
ncbi:MAG: tripartite tricarboxylate transporter substrate-binding protein [Clostridia bacterium]|nr:tripartite tricarboxylate transporter substrate-binding protein [Clostridia bacterium]